MITRDQLTPEESQEQNKHLVQDLGHYYDTRTEDNASLARIRKRLLQKTEASLPAVDTGKIPQLQIGVQPRRERDTRVEFRQTSAKGKARHPYLSTLAAAVLVAVLIGFFALVLQRPGTNAGSRQPEVSPIGHTLSSCASQPMPVWVDLCTHHQFTDLLQSRKMGTYIIELERAYLDMNQLLITYRVFSQSTGRQTPADLMDIRVSTSQGLSFQYTSGMNSEVAQFSSPTVPAGTRTLQFQVEVKALSFSLLQLPPAGTPQPQPSVVQGSATFDFTLSYHNGVVVTPHQTVTVNGSSVNLERVSISPSETIIEGTTKGTFPNLPDDYTFLLDAAGHSSSPTFSGFGGDSNPFSIGYDDGLLGQHGTWTFKISSASVQEGSWVFHFAVP